MYRMQGVALSLLLVAAAAAVPPTIAEWPDRYSASLAGHIGKHSAWDTAAHISSSWMHVPDTALSVDTASSSTAAAASAAAAATIEIGHLSFDEAEPQPRMLLQAPAKPAPPAAAKAAAAQKCQAYSKDMNQHTKDGYKLRWKAFSEKCSVACRKQAVIKVPDGVYKVYCNVQSCSCTLVSEATKKKYGGVRLEYAATRASDGAFVAAFVVKGELFPTAKACEECAGPYSFCKDC